MKRLILITLMVFTILPVNYSWAGEIDDLRDEVRRLREDYETKIDRLQDQIDMLTKKQRQQIAQIEEKVDKRMLDVEYVGRYEGPFKKGGLLIKHHTGSGNVSVGGYVDMEYEDFENSNSTFDQHRWVMNVGAELNDRLKFYSEYELEHGGPDGNNSGDGEAKVEQAWMDYLINNAINFRVGGLLVPFGRYNLFHDSDLQDLTDRPLVAKEVIPSTWTEAGAGFHGEFNPVIGGYEDLMLGYEFYVINGLDGVSDTGLSKGSLKSDNNNSKAGVARLVISPFVGHELGLSGYRGKYGAGEDNITGGAIDWFSTWGPVEIVGEAAHFKVDANSIDTVSNFFTGYYIQGNYRFWPEFLNNTFLGRDFEDPTLTLVARHGWVTIDDDDSDADTIDNEEERFTFGFNYRPVESWVMKFEYQWNNTDGETLQRGSNDGFIASVAMGF